MLKKLLLTIVAAALIAAMLAPGMALATGSSQTPADEPSTFNHNIDYSGNLPANAAQYIIPADNPDYMIDIDAEILYAVTEAAAEGVQGISLDGGKKWKPVSLTTEGISLTKAFNKGATIWLASVMDGKKPQEEVKATDDDPGVAAAQIYKFKKIEKRPKMGRVVVNYEVYGDGTGATNGQWTLTERNSSKPMTDGYQVALSLNRKVPTSPVLDANGSVTSHENGDKAMYGAFYANEGINVIGLNSSGKTQKITYFVRTAPDAAKGVPASKAKKFSVSGLLRETKYKADYKNEIVKLKANAAFFEGTLEELKLNTTPIEPVKKENVKAGTDISGALESDASDSKACAWLTATAKKPASSPQELNFAKRGILDESLQPTVKTGKASIQTKFLEIYNTSTNKWGSLPKITGDVELRVRGKATAKGGKENDTTFAASEEGKLIIKWGEYAEGKSGVTSALLIAEEHEGIFRLTPEEVNTFYVKESDTEPVQLSYDIKGLLSGHDVVIYDRPDDVKTKLDDIASTTYSGKVVIETKVTSPVSGDAIEITPVIAGKKLTYDAYPALIGATKIDFDVSFAGVDEDDYDKEKSGAATVTINVKASSPGVKLPNITGTWENENSSIFEMALAPSSSASVRGAKAAGGKLNIDRAGTILFNSEQKTSSGQQILSGYDSFKFASHDGDKDIPLPTVADFKNNAVGVVHGGTVFVMAEDTIDGERPTLFFAYSITDAFGPKMKTATINGKVVTITLDEELNSSPSTSGATFYLSDEDGKTIYQGPNGVKATDSTTIEVTFSEEPTGDDLVLTYMGYSGSSTLQDTNKNHMQTDSIPVDSDPVSITFANGSRGGSVTITNPKAVSIADSSYAEDSIAKIALAGTSTGYITTKNLNDGAYYYHRKSSTPAVGTPDGESGTLSPGTAITGISVGDHIYISAGSNNWYVFQVVKNNPATISNTKAPEISGGKFARTWDTGSQTYNYTLTLNLSANGLLEYGYGLQKNQFTLKSTAFTDASNVKINDIKYSGSTIVLTLDNTGASADELLKINTTGTNLSLDYVATHNGLADKDGNKMRSRSLSLTSHSLQTKPEPTPSSGS